MNTDDEVMEAIDMIDELLLRIGEVCRQYGVPNDQIMLLRQPLSEHRNNLFHLL